MAEEEYALFSLDQPVTLKHGFSLRRSHLEIRMDILSCVKGGCQKPTQIMYKANLSWNALKEHLEVLEKNNLLNLVTLGTRRTYELTEKAYAVLMAYTKILDEVNAPTPKPASGF
ncbi:MAG TPA: winged helix-turn-helix domain-containing protein [Nitrososphaerales archaeon]|nr:winged helix-turn-helix domain-containing protein [Nitrososphaerales archaeon]